MMYRYLKICVLSATVAMLCANGMYGVSFWCNECKEEIKKGSWGQHVFKKHKDDGRRPRLFCSEHPILSSKPGMVWRMHLCKWHDGEGWGESHLYNLWCQVCKTDFPLEEWEMHSEINDKNNVEIYEFRCRACNQNIGNGTGVRSKHVREQGCKGNTLPCEFLCKSCDCEKFFNQKDAIDHAKKHEKNGMETRKVLFRCQTCNEDVSGDQLEKHVGLLCDFWCKICNCLVLNGLGYSHLKELHSDILKPMLFYCKICKTDVTDWNEHVKRQHGGICEGFDCPRCKCRVNGAWETHVKMSHSGLCLFCSKLIAGEEDREVHMKKMHKIYCPFCKEQIFKVPLSVHIKREHEVWNARYSFSFCSCRLSQFCSGRFFLQHLFKVHKGTLCLCELCNSVMFDEHFKSHLNLFHQDRYFQCDVCHTEIEDCFREQHKCLSGLWCQFCQEMIPSQGGSGSDTYEHHLEEKHKSVKRCPFCKKFSWSKDYQRHLDEQHFFKCSKCEVRFDENSKLDEHMVSAHKWYRCPDCGKIVKERRSHWKLKHGCTFLCDFCESGFFSFKGYFAHMQEKHAEQGFVCKTCENFVRKDDKKAKWHKELHYVYCPLCQKNGMDNVLIVQDETFRQFAEHVIKEHKCKSACGWNQQTPQFEHASNCPNNPICPVCNEYFPEPSREDHRLWHGCHSECPFFKDMNGKEHHFDCREKKFPVCPMCWEKNIIRYHLVSKHDCSDKCRIVSEGGKWKVSHDSDTCLRKLQIFLCPVCFDDHADVAHMAKHDCLSGCALDQKINSWVHADNCPHNRITFKCDLCEEENVGPQHMMESHKCNPKICEYADGIWWHDSNCKGAYPPFKCPECGLDNANRAHMKENHCKEKDAACFQKKGTHTWIHDSGCPCWNYKEEDDGNENDAFSDFED